MSLTLESFSLFVSAIVLAILARYAWQRRHEPPARTFAAGMFFAVIWALEIAIELAIPGQEWKLLLARLRPLAHLGIFTSLTLVMVQITGDWRLRRRHYAALLIVPAITLALSFGAESHRLFRFHYRVKPYGSVWAATSDKGPWNTVLISYEYVLVAIASVIVLRAALAAQAEYRRVTLAMGTGWGSVVVVSLLEQFGGIAGKSGASSYAVTFATAVTAWAVLRRSALELVPVARDLVIDQMHGLLFVLDTRGKLVDCNLPAAKALGLPHNACREKASDSIPEPWGKVLAGAIRSKDASGRVSVGKPGNARVFESSVSLLRDRSGRPIGHATLFQDITENWHAEEVLRESEQRFRKIADTAPVILWLGGTDGLVTFFNRQASTFTGRPAEQLTGNGWLETVHPDDLEFARSTIGAADHGAHRAEFRMRRAGGEYRWMLAVAHARFIGDDYAGQIGTCTDITDIKRGQEENLARQKLESIGTLAGGIAHDFNNLLGGILANAELSLADPADAPALVEGLQNIRGAALRGSEIVRQLMVYSGRETAASGLVDVSGIVQEMTGLLKVSVTKQAAIEMSLCSPLPAVRANPAQLSQVVLNLVINASDALGDKPGTIRVRTAPGTADCIVLEVSDTGCGIPAAVQARIFDPYFSTKTPGRGLGLAVVQGIVRGLGGAIHVDSTLGRGTTVEVLLPVASGVPVADDSNDVFAGENVDSRGGTVLIVEDEEMLRLAVSKLLRREGFAVIEAADGPAAIEQLRTNSDVDVMFLDVTLPGLPSPEVLLEASRIRPGLRVVLTSAYDEQRVAALFAGLSFARFIRKPYLVAQVATMLRAMLSH